VTPKKYFLRLPILDIEGKADEKLQEIDPTRLTQKTLTVLVKEIPRRVAPKDGPNYVPAPEYPLGKTQYIDVQEARQIMIECDQECQNMLESLSFGEEAHLSVREATAYDDLFVAIRTGDQHAIVNWARKCASGIKDLTSYFVLLMSQNLEHRNDLTAAENIHKHLSDELDARQKKAEQSAELTQDVYMNWAITALEIIKQHTELVNEKKIIKTHADQIYESVSALRDDWQKKSQAHITATKSIEEQIGQPFCLQVATLDEHATLQSLEGLQKTGQELIKLADDIQSKVSECNILKNAITIDKLLASAQNLKLKVTTLHELTEQLSAMRKQFAGLPNPAEYETSLITIASYQQALDICDTRETTPRAIEFLINTYVQRANEALRTSIGLDENSLEDIELNREALKKIDELMAERKKTAVKTKTPREKIKIIPEQSVIEAQKPAAVTSVADPTSKALTLPPPPSVVPSTTSAAIVPTAVFLEHARMVCAVVSQNRQGIKLVDLMQWVIAVYPQQYRGKNPKDMARRFENLLTNDRNMASTSALSPAKGSRYDDKKPWVYWNGDDDKICVELSLREVRKIMKEGSEIEHIKSKIDQLQETNTTAQ
jgi:hypothetical protein